jgi:tetratricopeptide (TPR) repeat protein
MNALVGGPGKEGNVAKKKKRADRKQKRERPVPSHVAAGLREATACLRRREPDRAVTILERLAKTHSRDRDVLLLLAEAYQGTGDMMRYQSVAQRLTELAPNSPDLRLMLAGASLVNCFPAHALQAFQQFLERWPDHAEAGEARRTVADVEPTVRSMLAEYGLPWPEGLEVAVRHEDVQLLLNEGDYAKLHEVAGRLLQRVPDFVPAWNNSGEAYFREGRYADAIAAARRALELSPDNFHALSNLTRYLLLTGQADEARATAERLKAVASPNPDSWVKKAEALSYLGDDEGVLAAWRGAEQAGAEPLGPHAGFLNHLAAVAFFRQGKVEEARDLWRAALKKSPGLGLARDNLEDLKKPVGERHAPWPFAFNYWAQAPAIRELVSQIGKGDEDRVREGALRFLTRHPEVAALVPLLLDRGDPGGRLFALRLALIARTPELLAALRDFARGQRGPDQARLEAANAAAEAGLLPAGPTRLWMRGEWSESLLLSFEVTHEPTPRHPPEVDAVGSEGLVALRAGDGVRGEQFFRQALEMAPNAPDLLNNLAAALAVQGRHRESDDLVRRVYELSPDYFFGRVGMARIAIRAGELDKAAEYLQPLLLQRKLHVTELDALAAAEIEMARAKKLPEAAMTWVKLLADLYPESPNLHALLEQVMPRRGWLDMLRPSRRKR